MKGQQITELLIVAASVLVVSIVLAAQDRFSLKAPNGIAFSEFKGYEAWQLIAPSQPDNGGGCGSTPARVHQDDSGESRDDQGVQRRHSCQRHIRT